VGQVINQLAGMAKRSNDDDNNSVAGNNNNQPSLSLTSKIWLGIGVSVLVFGLLFAIRTLIKKKIILRSRKIKN